MRVLILSCNTGGGHNACADAIREAFVEHGDCCDIADSLSFVSDKLSRFISWGHTTVYRHIPGLSRAGYDFVEKHPAVLQEDAAAYKLLTNGTQLLANHIKSGQYTAVICTHVFAGMLLTQTMREYGISLRTGFVGTDYTCSPGTANSKLDYYFIPAASLTEEFIDRGVPARKIVPSGIPVRKDFCERPDKTEAKRAAGIDPTHVHLLMMCGSMGCGPMETLAEKVSKGLERDMELSIVCGTNTKRYSQLSESFADWPNIHVHGFLQNMSAIMDSADLYLTKPGGLSTTEAAMKNLPMVFVDTVAGCETYNLRYFVQTGGAVTADSTEQLAELCLKLMKDENRRTQMTQAMEAVPHINAAHCICNTILADGGSCVV